MPKDAPPLTAIPDELNRIVTTVAEAVAEREVIVGPQMGEVPMVLDHWVVHPFDVRYPRLSHGRGKRTPFRPAGGRRSPVRSTLVNNASGCSAILSRTLSRASIA